MAGGKSQTAVDAVQRFAEAHRALRQDPSVQFSLPPKPPIHPPVLPEWLTSFLHWLNEGLMPVRHALDWLTSFLPAAPYARTLLWSVIGAAAVALLWLIVARVREGGWRSLPLRGRARMIAAIGNSEDEWAPEPTPAHAWLDEADALAERGLYAEAVHHLLLRSVEDIQRRRPQLVRPSLTSRELAAATGLPLAARDLFTGIARLVERSLFGGRKVDADDWQSARADYANFALPRQWRS